MISAVRPQAPLAHIALNPVQERSVLVSPPQVIGPLTYTAPTPPAYTAPVPTGTIGSTSSTPYTSSSIQQALDTGIGSIGSSESESSFAQTVQNNLIQQGWSLSMASAVTNWLDTNNFLAGSSGASKGQIQDAGGGNTAAFQRVAVNTAPRIFAYIQNLLGGTATATTETPIPPATSPAASTNTTTNSSSTTGVPGTNTQSDELSSLAQDIGQTSGGGGTPGSGSVATELPYVESPATSTSTGPDYTIVIVAILAAVGLFVWYLYAHKKHKGEEHAAS